MFKELLLAQLLGGVSYTSTWLNYTSLRRFVAHSRLDIAETDLINFKQLFQRPDPVGDQKSLVLWINRCLEFLWLLSVLLVPLAFLPRDMAVSEAVIAYVEIPKVALLRSLAALMGLLWLMEWGLQGRFPLLSLFKAQSFRWRPGVWLTTLNAWLRQRPTRLVVLAVWFFASTTLLSTVFSGSFDVSLWGEVPGQDGYPAYTIIAYVLLFGVIASHLKTRPQLWRLLGALLLMGLLVSGYAVFQHYGRDFLHLTEISGGGKGRVTSFMGNAIFSAAVMMMVIPIALSLSIIGPRLPGKATGGVTRQLGLWTSSLVVLVLWGLALTVLLLGITFTFSRGSWLGTILALVVFSVLATAFVGWRPIGRASLIIGVTGVLALAALQSLGSFQVLDRGLWLVCILVLVGFVAMAAILAGHPSLGRHRTLAQGIGSGPVEFFGKLGPPVRAALTIGLAVVLLAVALSVFWLKGDLSAAVVGQSTTPIGDSSTASEVIARFSSISSQVSSGSLGGRGDYWNGSWRLIRDNPWFKFDSPSYSWLRPLLGYGPDMFRYVYLLESPPKGPNLLPEEPDQAHNFFINQAVEQGFLGLFSSLAIVLAVFLVGGYQLLKQGANYSRTHKLILIALLACLAGRFAEMMVGVARVSDLTILWVLLGSFVALPNVFRVNGENPVTMSAAQPSHSRRRNSQGRASSRDGGAIDWHLFLRLTVVSMLLGLAPMLIWLKNVNYVRASIEVGQAVEHFKRGEFQDTLAGLNRAVNLAPDVSPYHNYRAQVYFAFQTFDRVAPEIECGAQDQVPYDVCLGVAAFESNLEGVKRRPFYYRSRIALADSAFNLNQNDLGVGLYRESLSLVPQSWSIHNSLAGGLLVAGRPLDALQTLEKSLAITSGTASVNHATAEALRLQGMAYRDLDDLERSARALEGAFELSPYSDSALAVLDLLAEGYVGLGQFESAGNTYSLLGARHRSLGDLVKSGGFIELSADAFSQSGLSELAAESFFAQAMAYRSREEVEKSITFLKRSVELDSSAQSAARVHQALGYLYDSLGLFSEAASSFYIAGNAYWELGELDKALKTLERSLKWDNTPASALLVYPIMVDIYQRLGQPDQVAEHLFNEALSYRDLGKLHDAARSLDRLLAFRPSGDPQPEVYGTLAGIYERLGQPLMAAKYRYHEGLEYKLQGDLKRSAQALARSVELDSSTASAQRVHKILVQVYDQMGLFNAAAGSHFRLGLIYQDLGQWQDSVQSLGRSLELNPAGEDAQKILEILTEVYARLDQRMLEAKSAFLQGLIYRDKGELGKAIESLNRSLELDVSSVSVQRGHNVLAGIYEQLGQPKLTAKALFLEGSAYRGLGELDKASESLARSVALDSSGPWAPQAYQFLDVIAATMDRPELRANSYYVGAMVYQAHGELEKSARSFTLSGDIYASLGESEAAAKSFFLGGVAYRDLGELETSISLLERSQELDPSESSTNQQHLILAEVYEALNENILAAESRFQAGVNHLDTGDLYKAAKSLEHSLELDRSGENASEAHRLLAGIYETQGRDALASKYYFLQGLDFQELGALEFSVKALERSLRLDDSFTSMRRAHQVLAETYDALGQTELAALSLQLLGLAHQKLDQFEEALVPLARSIEIYKGLGRNYLAARSYFRLGEVYARMGHLEKAAQYYKISVELEGSGPH